MATSLKLPNLRTCFACGGEQYKLWPVGALAPEMKACSKCFLRHGQIELAREANRLMVLLAENPDRNMWPPKCLHCGKLKGYDKPICEECEHEAIRVANR